MRRIATIMRSILGFQEGIQQWVEKNVDALEAANRPQSKSFDDTKYLTDWGKTRKPPRW